MRSGSSDQQNGSRVESDRPSLKNNLARAGFQDFQVQAQDVELGGGEVKNDFEEHKQSLKNKDTRGHTGILSDIKSAHPLKSGAHGRVQS